MCAAAASQSCLDSGFAWSSAASPDHPSALPSFHRRTHRARCPAAGSIDRTAPARFEYWPRTAPASPAPPIPQILRDFAPNRAGFSLGKSAPPSRTSPGSAFSPRSCTPRTSAPSKTPESSASAIPATAWGRNGTARGSRSSAACPPSPPAAAPTAESCSPSPSSSARSSRCPIRQKPLEIRRPTARPRRGEAAACQ